MKKYALFLIPLFFINCASKIIHPCEAKKKICLTECKIKEDGIKSKVCEAKCYAIYGKCKLKEKLSK